MEVAIGGSWRTVVEGIDADDGGEVVGKVDVVWNVDDILVVGTDVEGHDAVRFDVVGEDVDGDSEVGIDV